MKKPTCLLFTVFAVVAANVPSLRAEDVIVTGCLGTAFNGCPPSCPDSLGNLNLYPAASSASPPGASRSRTAYAVTNTASWAVTPSLGTSRGVYRVYVSQGTTNTCSMDILVKIVATSGCTLADTNFVGQTEIFTPAFQRGASLNVWTPVAVISNTTAHPTIRFSYASGSSNRWYIDEVRFENLAAGGTTPARITQVLPGNPFTLAGTGAIGRPFALVSSTDAAKPLAQWTPSQTNTAGTGAFSFTVSPGKETARFFRVTTQ